MPSIARTAASLAAATVLATSVSALGASPASAATDRTAPRVVDASLSKNVAGILYRGKDKVTVTVRVTDNVGVTEVWAPLYRKGTLLKDDAGNYVVIPLRRVSGTARDGVWSQRFWATRGDDAGVLKVGVVAYDAARNYNPLVYAGRLRTKYETHISGFGVTPASAPKNAPRTLSGRLVRLDGDGKWENLAGQLLRVQFRPSGRTAWQGVGKIRTDAEGRFQSGVRTAVPGVYRVLFAGDSLTLAEISKSERVRLS